MSSSAPKFFWSLTFWESVRNQLPTGGKTSLCMSCMWKVRQTWMLARFVSSFIQGYHSNFKLLSICNKYAGNWTLLGNRFGLTSLLLPVKLAGSYAYRSWGKSLVPRTEWHPCSSLNFLIWFIWMVLIYILLAWQWYHCRVRPCCCLGFKFFLEYWNCVQNL